MNFGLLLGVLVLGGVGLAGAATFVAALIAQAASGKSALFFIVAFPVLMPVLLIAVQATVGAFDAGPFYRDARRSRPGPAGGLRRRDDDGRVSAV